MKGNQKRQIILKAAAECFSRFGFDKTTLDDIGRLAKLNKASLYYYFKNKEEIFMQVVLQESEIYIAKLQEKVASLPTCEEEVQTYLAERLRYYREVVNLNQLSLERLQQIQPMFDQLYKIVWQKEVDFIESLLSKAMETGELSIKEDAESLAESIITIADALKHEEIRNSEALFASDVDYSSIERKMEQIIRIIFRGLKS